MKRQAALTTWFLFAWAFLSNASFAANDCNVVNFKDTSNFLQNIRTYLSFVNTTNASNFEQRKTDLNTGATALIQGVPFKGFANFSDFNARKSQLLTSFDYKMTIDQDTKYDTTLLSKNDLDAYIACLKNTKGLDVVAVHQSNYDVTFKILWNPPFKTSVTAFQIASTGGKLLTPPIPPTGEVSAREEFPLVFTLQPNEPFHLIVTTAPPEYSVDVDYLIPKYKVCRVMANGLELNPDGTEHITIQPKTWLEPNGRFVDYNNAWAVVYASLQKEGHTNIKRIDQSEVDGKDNKHGKIDRNYTFTVSYDAQYREAENPLCGIATAAAEPQHQSSDATH